MQNYLFTLCLLLPTVTLPSNDIDGAKTTIIAILQQKNPAVIAEFKDFYRQYYESVTRFFDVENNEPLTTHITRMEDELQVLKNVCSRADFSPVRHILLSYTEQVAALITVLKKYVGSKNSLALALNVRDFKALLPPAVKNRGNIALFKALHHRLHC